MAASRRFETSLKRLKCANTGQSATAAELVNSIPLLPFEINPMIER